MVVSGSGMGGVVREISDRYGLWGGCTNEVTSCCWLNMRASRMEVRLWYVEVWSCGLGAHGKG